jgi:hypothetical protein
MPKTLTQMNVQLANVISDIGGVTGMAIRRAIVAGERDPDRLSTLKHKACRPEPHPKPKRFASKLPQTTTQALTKRSPRWRTSWPD